MTSKARSARILQRHALLVAIIAGSATVAPGPPAARDVSGPAAGSGPARAVRVERGGQSIPAQALALPPGRRVTPAAVARGGMVVARDPETGAFGPPTPEQWQELTAGTSTRAASATVGPVEIRGTDGSFGLDLRGAPQDYATVRVGSDGRLRFGCSHADSASVSLPAPASTPTTDEEK